MDTPPSPPQTPRADPVFRAFVAPVKRHYARWIAGLVVLAAASYALASRRDPHSFTVITRYGIRQVRLEMTENQVLSVLGKPLASAEGDGCYRYGMPQLNRDFDVYKVCFNEGRVHRVETERFEVREIPTPDDAKVDDAKVDDAKVDDAKVDDAKVDDAKVEGVFGGEAEQEKLGSGTGTGSGLGDGDGDGSR